MGLKGNYQVAELMVSIYAKLKKKRESAQLALAEAMLLHKLMERAGEDFVFLEPVEKTIDKKQHELNVLKRQIDVLETRMNGNASLDGFLKGVEGD